MDFINNFPKDWTPRSLAYRQGMQAGYDWRMAIQRGETLKSANCPYPIGSADADAWFAGWDHGVAAARKQGGMPQC